VTALVRVVLALCLLLPAATALAQEEGATEEPTAEQEAGPAGPTLVPDNPTPAQCGATQFSQSYVNVRGTGFDAYATQRLPGTLVDASGSTQASWKTIWVSPQGNLLLPINLCADAFLRRPPLQPGDYFITVFDPTSNAPIAQTAIEVQEEPTETPTPSPTATGTPTATATPAASLVPTVALSRPPTSAASTPTPAPRTGLGSQRQPLPLGSSGDVGDGWGLTVTGVTPDAWSAIQAFSSDNKGPPTNLQYFMVRVQLVYTGPLANATYSGLRLRLAGPSTTYDPAANSCGQIPDALPGTGVAPAGVVRGNVCFAVRSTDVPSLVLYDSTQPASTRLYFALH
jgi:hypothetical protein